MAMEFSDFALWGLTAVCAFLGKRVIDQGDQIKDLKQDLTKEVGDIRLEMETEFQRKEDLRIVVSDAIKIAIGPLTEKLAQVEAKIEGSIRNLDAQRKDLNVILDRLEIPVAHRHQP